VVGQPGDPRLPVARWRPLRFRICPSSKNDESMTCS
jgi:hypothetical protein